MNKGEFMEGIHILQNNYNNKLSTEQLKLYYENLKDLDKESFINNINEQIKTNPFMPNIAQLRNKQFVKKANRPNHTERNYDDIDWNQFYANNRK